MRNVEVEDLLRSILFFSNILEVQVEILTTTFAPSRARRIAVALPIPFEPPVMRATLPERGLIEDMTQIGTEYIRWKF